MKAVFHNMTHGTINVLEVMYFMQNTWNTIYAILDDCEFLSLYYSILKLANPLKVIFWALKLLLWKIFPLLKADALFLWNIVKWNPYGQGYNFGRIFSVVFDWEIQ